MSQPTVLLSAFADEAANSKTIVEQFSSLAALGLQYYSPRFLDLEGTGKVEHVTELSDAGFETAGKTTTGIRSLGLQHRLADRQGETARSAGHIP